MAFEQQKEAFAEQIARLIRLMPNYPGGIMFGMGDTQETTATVLYEQKTQDMYFRIFDMALSYSWGMNLFKDDLFGGPMQHSPPGNMPP